MICNKYNYGFWKTVIYFAFSAVQLHVEMLTIILCQRCSQLGKNKEIILHLTRNKRNMFQKKNKEVVGSNKVVLLHTFWVLKFLTLSSNNWTSSFVQIKFISGDLFNFSFFFGGIFTTIFKKEDSLNEENDRPVNILNRSS